MEWRWRLQATVLVFALYSCQAAKRLLSFHSVHSLSDDSAAFRHMVIDEETENLYVGAINSLFVLSAASLTRLHVRRTGPKPDNLNCPPVPTESCPGSLSRSDQDSVPQALILDTRNKALVVCSTLYYGFCERISLTNFSDVRPVYISVVPNDGAASVVAFVGGDDRAGRLYVAATHSDVGLAAYQRVPMIAIRSLWTLALAEDTTMQSSQLDLRYEARETTRVVYKYGFSHQRVNYFVSVRATTDGGVRTLRSALARVCDDDLKFASYVEVPLECTSSEDDDARYTVVQSAFLSHPGRRLAEHLASFITKQALFVTFNGNDARSPTAVMCVYSMEYIQAIFQRNTQSCFKGYGNLGPRHIAEPSRCVATVLEIDANYCGGNGMNYPIDGSQPVVKRAILELQGYTLSAMLIKSVAEFTFAFLGTDRGQLLMLVLSTVGSTQQEPYDVVMVEDGASIKPDLLFDKAKTHIYAMTSKMVYKILLSNCAAFSTCESCREARDPHCGWCTQQNKCTFSAQCAESAVSYYWISFNKDCPSLAAVKPDVVQKLNFLTTRFEVFLSHMPLSNGETTVQCELTNQMLRITGAVLKPAKISTNITCAPFATTPDIPANKGYVNMELAVILNGSFLASKEIYIYDCSLHMSCKRCADTIVDGCVWCLKDNKCVGDQTHCTTPHRLMGNQALEMCPKIKPIRHSKTLIASGNSTRVVMNGLQIQGQFMTNFKCHFAFGGGITVNATVGRSHHGVSKIVCQLTQFSYPEEIGNVSALIEIYWGTHNVLDNPNGMQIEVYKCAGLVPTCGLCLTLDPRYQCGWCGDRCSLAADCSAAWLNRQDTCPDPHIDKFEPMVGPVQGGTAVHVYGRNLGRRAGELVVTIAGEPCAVQALNYNASASFVCITDNATTVKNGSIVLTVNEMYTATSEESFNYVTPVLLSMSPLKGPLAGGTAVTLVGEQLDIGTNATVTMGDNLCPVIRRSASRLVFVTASEPATGEREIVVALDRQRLSLSDKFTYVEDPTITAVEPLYTIISGGTDIRAHGTNLDSVVSPEFLIQLDHQNLTSACRVTSPTLLTCTTPSLRHLVHRPNSFQFGFVMDGVTALRRVSRRQDAVSAVTVLNDPLLSDIGGGDGGDGARDYEDGMVLHIEGKHMEAFEFFDQNTKVSVGDEACTSLEVTAEFIRCQPPAEPPTLDDQRNALVRVQLGGLHSDVGLLHYAGPSELPLPLIIGVLVALVVLVVVVVVAVVFCRRRRRHRRLRGGRQKPRKVNSYNQAVPPRRRPLDAGNGSLPPAELVPLRTADERSRRLPPEPVEPALTVLDKVKDDNLRNNIQEVLISNDRLILQEALGKGHFGCVYAAILDPNTPAATKVAVKTLQGNQFDEKAVESFLKEGVTMKNFDHPHILRLLGMCMDEHGNPMVILPYMANGDLRSYVKDKKKSFTARQLLRLSQQVAEGMTYLASLNFVHRDLAARNCMIDEEMTVKVSDFGLSRSLYEKKYYVSMDQQRCKMPIKWMALESLDDMIFTTKSDVWSFGVLMWELMTRCVTPYPDVDVFDMRNYLVNGQRLKQPKYCPSNIYKIMCSCWDIYPERRPTFTDLVNRLEMLLNPPAAAPPPPQANDEHTYINLAKAGGGSGGGGGGGGGDQTSDYLSPVTFGGGGPTA